MKEKIQHMAFYDALTGIPNRYKLNKHLQESIIRCKRNNEQLAVLFLDLDWFKFINDSKGHSTDDLLLKQVADRLVKAIRKTDMVARQGGDEFVLLLQDIEPLKVIQVSERITESLQKPFVIDDEELFTTPSIGISLYPQDGEDEETLINNADKAMYTAKKRGKNNFQFYSHEQEDGLKRRAKIEQFLRRAIENQEFILHYQPEICLQTGEVFGTEALLRWKHPELGAVPPSDFIPVAEEIGMIVIDKSFISESPTKPNTASLIKTIIKMGEDFNFDLVAEGIETKEQAEFITKSGCHLGQGYYYSKPLPAKEFGACHAPKFVGGNSALVTQRG